jgi:hypothetical protein
MARITFGPIPGYHHSDRVTHNYTKSVKASPGDRVDLRAPAKTERLEIINVEYAPIPMDPFREPLGAQSKPKVEGS